MPADANGQAGAGLRLTNCRLFDGEKSFRGRDVVIRNTRVAAIVAQGEEVGFDTESVDLDGMLLAPGLIDLQVNGGGGVLFNDAPEVATLASIAAAHRRYGTTAFLPTLITDRDEVIDEALKAVETAIRDGVPGVVGIHLEGPYLNPAKKGVHDPARMRELDAAAINRIGAFSAGPVLLTLAPEKTPVAMIRQLDDLGIVVCGGHSNATYAETREALDNGLRGFTHLYNAMSALGSREPGMVGAALEDRRSFFGIIADGYHVHPAAFAVAVAAKQAGGAILVSDAMPSVGSALKSFELFGETVHAAGGCCRTADGTLAGSDIGLIDAVRNAVRFAGLDRFEALRMASTYPAKALGLGDELGYIRPGYRACLIAVDDHYRVRRSWIDGVGEMHGEDQQ